MSIIYRCRKRSGKKQLLCLLSVILLSASPLLSGEETPSAARDTRDDKAPVIEKLLVINGFTRKAGKTGAADGPNLLFVDEASGEIAIPQGSREGGVLVRRSAGDSTLWEALPAALPRGDGGIALKLGPWRVEASAASFSIETGGRVITRLDSRDVDGGLAFVLESGGGNYACFFVNGAGEAAAADTRGMVYRKKEAVQLLRLLDGGKFGAAMERAAELGLSATFQNGEVLVWGRNYYAPARILNRYWDKMVYPLGDGQIQYDSEGNGYQLFLDQSGQPDSRAAATIWIADPDGNSKSIDLSGVSEILGTYGAGREFTIAFHVDAGPDIYFFVAGDEYTELFRIRAR